MKELLLGTALAVFSACAAFASCAPREVIVDRLAERYGESRQSVGLGSNNSIVETWASLETGTWTITVTSTAGMMCLVASGQSFELVHEVLVPGEDM